MIFRRAVFLLMLVFLFRSFAGTTNTATISTNSPRPWREYRTILWMGESVYRNPEKVPLVFSRMREMGINTGMLYGDGNPEPLLTNQFPYYVENIVNRGLCLKFNSRVQNWDKFVTDWTRNGRLESGLVREYCLDDPEWREWAKDQMRKAARKNAAHAPLAYNIRDELSTTVSANPFDFDFNPLTLRSFREWLKTQYGDLDYLNRRWQTRFTSWDEIKPFTTDYIKHRMATCQALPTGNPDWAALQRLRFSLREARNEPTRWNFSPWADFRTYMDLSLARALDDLRLAAREIDPATPVGIEGTQMPHAFGGYDLWRLSKVLDWVEPYDIGNAREILGSFMPGKPILSTVFETETDRARRRLWHLLLEGDRGCIIWWSEDCIDWSSPDYRLTSKARALQPVLAEMRSPLAQLFLLAERQDDPVFIHYSQPSIQADWLIESTVDGSTWLRRFSSFEAEHNRQAKIRQAWLKLYQDLGFNPRFVSSAQIESGVFRETTNAVFVLPCSWALSDREGEEISEFLDSGGTIFFDGAPGVFDEHCRLRSLSPLERYFPTTPDAGSISVAAGKNRTNTFKRDIAGYLTERLGAESSAPDWNRWVTATLAAVQPQVVVPPATRTRAHRYKVGGTELLAFERNILYQMSEDLKQAGGNEDLEKPVAVEARLRTRRHVYNLRTRQYLGETDVIRFILDPWEPSLFALSSTRLNPERTVEDLLAGLE